MRIKKRLHAWYTKIEKTLYTWQTIIKMRLYALYMEMGDYELLTEKEFELKVAIKCALKLDFTMRRDRWRRIWYYPGLLNSTK